MREALANKAFWRSGCALEVATALLATTSLIIHYVRVQASGSLRPISALATSHSCGSLPGSIQSLRPAWCPRIDHLSSRAVGLLGEIHPADQVLKARLGTQAVHLGIGPNKVEEKRTL